MSGHGYALQYMSNTKVTVVLGGTTVLSRYHFFTVPVPWNSRYFWYRDSKVVRFYRTVSAYDTQQYVCTIRTISFEEIEVMSIGSFWYASCH